MARLFSLNRATAVDDPEFGHFDADEQDGGFEFPDDLSDRLHRFGHRGKQAWETEAEREQRLHQQESSRRRDPGTLYDAVEQIALVTKQLADLQLAAAGSAPADGDAAPAKPPRKAAAPKA
jgi:hypothetical protein